MPGEPSVVRDMDVFDDLDLAGRRESDEPSTVDMLIGERDQSLVSASVVPLKRQIWKECLQRASRLSDPPIASAAVAAATACCSSSTSGSPSPSTSPAIEKNVVGGN